MAEDGVNSFMTGPDEAGPLSAFSAGALSAKR
jgi:hypothetical protein